MRQGASASSPASSSETRAAEAEGGDPAGEEEWSRFGAAPVAAQTPEKAKAPGRQPAADAALIQRTLDLVGPAADELTSPAWWDAEIVAHETRPGGIGVPTVRPGEPYPFRAGQYASLETPWWPRVWRNYSFASAPREDGLLTFPVRAVPSGWVSTAWCGAHGREM